MTNVTVIMPVSSKDDAKMKNSKVTRTKNADFKLTMKLEDSGEKITENTYGFRVYCAIPHHTLTRGHSEE